MRRGCYERQPKEYWVLRSLIVYDKVKVTAMSTEMARDVAADEPIPKYLSGVMVRMTPQKWQAKRLKKK